MGSLVSKYPISKSDLLPLSLLPPLLPPCPPTPCSSYLLVQGQMQRLSLRPQPHPLLLLQPQVNRFPQPIYPQHRPEEKRGGLLAKLHVLVQKEVGSREDQAFVLFFGGGRAGGGGGEEEGVQVLQARELASLWWGGSEGVRADGINVSFNCISEI